MKVYVLDPEGIRIASLDGRFSVSELDVEVKMWEVNVRLSCLVQDKIHFNVVLGDSSRL